LKTCPEDVLNDVNRHAPFTCWDILYDENGIWTAGGPTKGCGKVFAVNLTTRETVLIDEKAWEE
jgi:hypothetical protein